MLTEIRTEQSALISQESTSSQVLRDRGRSSSAAFSQARQNDQLSVSQEAKEELAQKQAHVSTPDQTSEDFVRGATPIAQEQSDRIAWAHGTYHAGRLPQAATGPTRFGASGTTDLSLAQEQRQAFAAHSYSRMSRQGVMPKALAPLGTGISLTI
ncbi:MAG: hypothetical protein K6G15_02945 [Desulfovibrio sp.]|nr:hypothetical protein [Desulfovibrio sp.]